MAIKLTTDDKIAETSSKGNQEKWLESGRWYKLDSFGYEGLSETVTSALLAKTNVEALGFRYVTYRVEKLEVHNRVRVGCSSQNFLQSGESILTLSDLLRKGVGSGWQAQAAHEPNMQKRLAWMVQKVENLTGLERFGEYLTLLFEVDMLFGNEDRHLNNIAVLRQGDNFDYCPIFDFGAGLLSNVRDFPMDVDPKALIRLLRARPLNTTFPRQVHAAQANWDRQLICSFTAADVAAVLDEPLTYYSRRDTSYIRDRAEVCIAVQRKKLNI